MTQPSVTDRESAADIPGPPSSTNDASIGAAASANVAVSAADAINPPPEPRIVIQDPSSNEASRANKGSVAIPPHFQAQSLAGMDQPATAVRSSTGWEQGSRNSNQSDPTTSFTDTVRVYSLPIMAKQSHIEDDDGTSSRVSDSMIQSSGHGNQDGEKGSDGEDMREGASNMRRAATDLPRTKSPYTRRSAYLTTRQRAAVASRFYNELKRNTLVGEDYKVQIHTDNFPRELQEEFLHMFAQPQDQAGREGEVIAPRAAESVGKLNICILIVGTRGDVQPFIAIGQKLKGYGHRVRLASHSNYREFVAAGGLEFYPLGGDPKVLAEYMVKNKGFLPSSRKEVLQQRKQLKSIIFSTWPACTQPDLASNGAPFRADAIIANPPVYGHTTVAEALQVPLHMFFTMPWSMTTEYPHPLAGEMPAYTGYENQLSYVVVEGLMWLGVRDFINSFRKKLKLPPIPLRNRPKMRIPFGYIWSPTLAPKPHDWGNLIDVVGFCFLNLAEHYSPPAHIQQWLDSGPPPIFIGFGSLPVSDPKGLTQKIVEALERTGQRGILQEGWGGLGKMETPNENVLVIGNCPHDWLFPRCRAVLHHGGAGTTAAGLKAACPTTIIPFFGDQPFWGARVHAVGVGPEPIPIGSLTLDKIVAAIEFMIRDEVVAAARELAGKIAKEDGVDGAVEAFHKHLPPGYHSQEQCTPWLEASPGADYGSDCSCWPWSCGDTGEEEEEKKS